VNEGFRKNETEKINQSPFYTEKINQSPFYTFVRGEQRLDSDIDLLVEFEPQRKTFDAFIEIAFLLEDSLQHKVELITVESLSPYLGPHILKEVE
jgi:hypothetical protein